MWRLTTHTPDGPQVEDFETRGAATDAMQRGLDLGFPVTLDPAGWGLPVASRCSFCEKPRLAVERLCAGSAGAGVAICNECVVLVSEMIAAEGPAPVD
jgi:hypothetical protein